MKKIFILFCFLVACEANTANPPPTVLIPEAEMENILYDINLLRTIKSNRFGGETSNEILNNQYILRKYNIADSTLKQNQTYYAQSPKRLFAMYDRIYKRLEKAEDSVNILSQKEQEAVEKRLLLEKERIAQKARDSIYMLMAIDSIDLFKWKDSLGIFKGKDSVVFLKWKDSVRVLRRKDSLTLLKRKDSLAALKKADSLFRLKRVDTTAVLKVDQGIKLAIF